MEIEVENLTDFVQQVNLLYLDWETTHGDIWFRGITNKSYELVPGIKWRNADARKENTVIEEFLLYSPPLLEEKPKNAWEQYALMQHYGLPTRLLDWTKSPLVALFFALNSKEKNDRVVWCIDPFCLNKLTTQKETVFTPKEFDEDDGIDINTYLPKALRKNKSKEIPPYPIAIEPPFANRRILAQQGCFTVHGWESKAINMYLEEKANDKIKKILIPSKYVNELKADLCNIGIREDTIFQDLNSLSKRIIDDFFTFA